MSADRGNKNFRLILFFRYASYSNRNSRLSLMGALILPLEAIPKLQRLFPGGRGYPRALEAIPWLGTIPQAFRATPKALGPNSQALGDISQTLRAIPQVLGAISQVLGAIFWALGAIPRVLEANPCIFYLEQSPLRRMPQKKLLTAFTIGQIENDTEINYLQHLQG